MSTFDAGAASAAAFSSCVFPGTTGVLEEPKNISYLSGHSRGIATLRLGSKDKNPERKLRLQISSTARKRSQEETRIRLLGKRIRFDVSTNLASQEFE
jgi:hypothetical protein